MDLITPSFDLCSRAYCGLFDYLDEKIGHERTTLLKTISVAVGMGIAMASYARAVSLTPLRIPIVWAVAGLAHVVHQYVTEALCRRGTQLILEKNAQNGQDKETAVIVNLLFSSIGEIAIGREFLLRRDVRQLAPTFSLQILESKSLEAWNRALDLFPDASIAYLLIRAHGYTNGIHVGNNKYLIYYGPDLYEEATRKNMRKSDLDMADHSLALLKKIGAKVKKNGRVVLSACSTGRGTNNLKKGFEVYCPQAMVHAPSSDIRYTYIKNDLTPAFCGCE